MLRQTSIAFGNTVPNFSPNDRKRVFMMIKPRIVNIYSSFKYIKDCKVENKHNIMDE